MEYREDINLSRYLIQKRIGQENADKELETILNRLNGSSETNLTQEQIEEIALRAYEDYRHLIEINKGRARAFSQLSLNTLIGIYCAR